MSSNTENSPNEIGILQTTSLVTGNLVGSGVFLLPASLALYGSISLLGWLLTGIGALLLALVFCFLSTKTQETGGPHNFVLKQFGSEAGFWVAWGYWMLSWISNAALIVAAVSYFSPMMGGLSLGSIFILEVAILVVVTLINLKGIKLAGNFEFLMTTLKVLPLAVIPIIGLFYINFDNFMPLINEGFNATTALKGSMFLCIWAFVGLETGTVPSAQVRNASKTVPRATLLGTSLALVVYLLGFGAMIGVMGTAALSQSQAPYADLAQAIFGGNWTILITMAAIICCLGSFNGWTLVVGRIAQGAALQHLFPKIFAKEDAKGTPTMSLIISSACTFPLLVVSLQENLVDQFNQIIDVSITLILIIYTACVLSYLKSRDEHSSKWGLLVGVGALLFSIFCIWAAGITMIFMSFGLLALGIPFWIAFRKSKKNA